jgi:NADH-quinone oxidoreductase subunit C
MMDIHKTAEDALKERFADKILNISHFREELTILVEADALAEMIDYLRAAPEFTYNFLTDLTATDWPDDEKRHEVVYLLYSFDNHSYIRLKVRLAEGEKLPSLTPIWDIANWFEREVYDLYGVEFEGHPNLTRILTPDGFEGFPLRKDYPLTYELPRFTHNKSEPPEVIK